MIIDLNSIDLIKGINRTEAKAVHKDLPPGGTWRTIKGHHVYIVGNKIVAGSIPGVTKAKKMTKATIAEHQANVDAEGKKTNAKSKSKSPAKAPKPAGKKSGSNPTGTSGKTKTKASGSGKKAGEVNEVPSKPKKTVSGKKSGSKPAKPASAKPAPAKPAAKTAKPGAKKSKVAEPKEKANATKQVGAKTDDKSKAKPTAKSSGTGKPVSAIGAEKGASEGNTQNQPAAAKVAETVSPAISTLKSIAKTKDLGDFLATVSGNPDFHKAMKEHMSKEQKTMLELHKEWSAEDQHPVDTEPTPEDHFEVFHGTRLHRLEAIREHGFRLNGTDDDFGNAAYFKSPSFDHKDDEDYQKWIDSRKSKGHPIPKGYEGANKYSSDKIVNGFAGSGSERAVLRAFIPKEHVLDCSQGRPPELQEMIDDYKKHTDGISRKRLVMKHLLGEDIDPQTSASEVSRLYEENKQKMLEKWGAGKFFPGSISPYEIYAKKTGVKAIVDKLDHYDDEGWQIGVYDPKVIQLKEHGRNVARSKEGVKLMKALAKAKAAGYCLLHHEIDDEGLHLHVGVLGGTMEKSFYIDLSKAITRTQAKAAHKELPPGGEWRTIKGHHIYIVGGKIVAGSVPGATKAKKATKAQLAEHQTTIDSEKNPKKAASKAKAKPAAKKEPVKKAPAKKEPAKAPAKKAPAKKAPAKKAEPKKAPAKAPAKAKDIRTDAQKNRELAYDVGDKVGGARKDEFIASFKEKPTAKSLEELEKMSGAIAEKMVTKANLLPKYDFGQEHDNGVDLPTAILKKLIYDRIAPKPDPSNPETRKAYMATLKKVQRHFEGIKSFENMRDALREVSVMARKEKAGKEAEGALARYTENPGRFSYFNSESYHQRAADGREAAKFMDFHALGDKFNSLLTNYESLNRSIDTVRKNTKEGWDKYLNPQAKAAPKKKGDANKKWEREAVSEHLRKGGKETKVKKPEDLMKEFNLRGVEFGHWVNDSSGLFHLKRSAEAFEDLSDIIGVNKQDISLNGRLAIAFGARGKGGALAHYEPDRKVINMTKHGGAGSLAHEWGHAMDNILQQYSDGGQESLGLASQGQMGNNDPKLKALYNNVMEAITKPAPGEKGGVTNIVLDSSVKSISRYYPEMRKQIASGMEPKDVYEHWMNKTNTDYDRYIHNAKNNERRTEADKAKVVKQYEQKRKRELNDLPHYIANEMKYKNGGYRGEDYKGNIEVPTGKSEYMTRMEENQPGKTQNGVHYWSAPEEMFARVFESYVQEKMKKANRENNYLVHGTSEGAVKAMDAPFPLGKERQHMFKAMENLLKYVGSKGTLKKALILEILAHGSGDMTEDIQKSLGYTKRSAYNVANPEEVIYIPVNRLKTPYQTEKATNWDKVQSNYDRMMAGEHLEPVSIGLDYDVHDGHHRIEAAKKCGHEHIPCIVKGGNDLERQNAIEAYREVWKSIESDPTGTASEEFPMNYENSGLFMFRGIGHRELKNIKKTRVIQSKGKGNDDDKGTETCFSPRYGQAEGYARSNYDLYDEPYAYVLIVNKPEDIEEDEHGELVAKRPIPIDDIHAMLHIPKPE